MKANEFFKQVGISEAKQILKDLSFNEWRKNKEYYDNLKRLVESHEWVDSVGGMVESKNKLKELKRLLKHRPMDYSAMNRFCAIERAISDVESCQ